MQEKRRARICVLVKAYPQPSEQYEETVCVAGVDVDTGSLLRLYPIPFRRLAASQQFDRYDVIDVELWRDTSDQRSESHKVNPDTIRVISRRDAASAESRVRIWRPSITPEIAELERRMKEDHVTLGIVGVEPESLRFTWKATAGDDEEDRALSDWIAKQQPLLADAPLKPLTTPYSFYLKFRSGNVERTKRLMDWEAQATYAHYERRYGAQALEKMKEFYEERLRTLNPHLFLGTMKKTPFAQLILIGVLRSSTDPMQAAQQGTLLLT